MRTLPLTSPPPPRSLPPSPPATSSLQYLLGDNLAQVLEKASDTNKYALIGCRYAAGLKPVTETVAAMSETLTGPSVDSVDQLTVSQAIEFMICRPKRTGPEWKQCQHTHKTHYSEVNTGKIDERSNGKHSFIRDGNLFRRCVGQCSWRIKPATVGWLFHGSCKRRVSTVVLGYHCTTLSSLTDDLSEGCQTVFQLKNMRWSLSRCRYKCKTQYRKSTSSGRNRRTTMT